MAQIVSRAACIAIAFTLPTAVLAEEPVLQPIQVGSETLRYDRGVPTLDLQMEQGSVQIRPLPMDHGSLAFSVAVFNAGNAPANFGIENFSVRAGEKSLAIFSVDQLISKAKNRARWKQIGVGILGGLAASAAASQRDTYYGSLHTPYGSYFSTYSAPSAVGQLQATAIAAGTGYSIAVIQSNLDRTREALGENVIQTTTLDPGQSYAGKVVLQKVTSTKRPERVSIVVNWNGQQYPFAFQLAKPGTTAPEFTTLAPTAPYVSPQPMKAAEYVAQTLPTRLPRALPAAVAQAGAAQPDVSALISKTALYMERPHELDDGSVISEFRASGNELVMTAAVPKGSGAFSEYTKRSAAKAICGRRAFVPLLQGGATIRANYIGTGKRRVGEVVVTSADCFG
jgi:hypothetical protein